MCDHEDEGLDWEDIALAGALAVEMAEDEREKERLRKKMIENENDVNDDKED